MRTSRKARVTASPEEQEQAILDAATTEFIEIGVRQANMDSIAKVAGVSRSTLYRRFPSKDNLLIALANDIFERKMLVLEESAAGKGPQEAVVEAFVTGADLVNNDPLIRRIVLEDYEMRNVTASLSVLFIDMVTKRVAQTLRDAGATMDEADLLDAVEIQVRLVISYLEVPSLDESKRQPESVRVFATKFLAPMIH